MITRHGPIDAIGAAVIIGVIVFVVLFVVGNDLYYRWERRRR